MPTRWLFADQLSPHFLDEPDQLVLLIESQAAAELPAEDPRQPVAEAQRAALQAD